MKRLFNETDESWSDGALELHGVICREVEEILIEYAQKDYPIREIADIARGAVEDCILGLLMKKRLGKPI